MEIVKNALFDKRNMKTMTEIILLSLDKGYRYSNKMCQFKIQSRTDLET